MRLLGVVRLSADTDATTSPERQREALQAQAAARGDTLVAIAEDLDVSGALSPFERPALGPWLRRSAEWDALVVAKLDRLTRSLLDFQSLLMWCREHGKSIVSVTEGIDFGTPHGQLLANIVIMFAQFERERIAERRREGQDKLRAQARWGGGSVPFGYRPKKIANGGWELVPDAETAKIAREMARDAGAGKSAAQIARDLNERGVPTPQKRGQWRATSVLHILRSPALRGWVTGEKGKIERGPDGLPVKREPILDDAQWRRLQAALDNASQQRRMSRHDAAPLLGVARCAKCQAPMYALRQGGGRWCYYQCANRQHQTCDARGVPMADLEAKVERRLLTQIGHKRWQQPVESAAEDHTAELRALEEQIDDLEATFLAREIPAEIYGRTAARLVEQRDRLKEMPSRPASVEWVATDQTFAQKWESEDEPGRRKMLLTISAKAWAQRLEDGSLDVVMTAHPSLGLR